MSLLNFAEDLYQKAELGFWHIFQQWIADPRTEKAMRKTLHTVQRVQSAPLALQAALWLGLGFALGIPLQFLLP